MQRHEQEEKGHVVGVADAVCDPVAVVVHPCDAAAAETAVLAAGRLGDLAGAADVVAMEDDVVVRVGVLVGRVGGGDGRGGGAGAEVGEDIGEGEEDQEWDEAGGGHGRERGGEEEGGGAGEDEEVYYLENISDDNALE